MLNSKGVSQGISLLRLLGIIIFIVLLPSNCIVVESQDLFGLKPTAMNIVVSLLWDRYTEN